MGTSVGITNPSLFSPSDLDLNHLSVFTPVVFKSGFNHFEKINATQAWLLFFTGGREDNALGLSPTVGRFFNFSLIIIASILWTLLFRPF
jgi:hypothetical protein